MQGFDPKFKDFPDYIIGITKEIWEDRGIATLHRYYSDDIVVRFQKFLNKRSKYKVTFVAYNDAVKMYIKATLGEQLYGKEIFEQIIAEKDDMIDEVITLSKGQ